MFTRFIDIINNLESLSKDYTNSKLIQKILRSLSKNWEAKITVIQETKYLNGLSLDELIGSLMTHKLSINQNIEEEIKKRRTIALKLMANEDQKSDMLEESDNDDEMTMITRKFKDL